MIIISKFIDGNYYVVKVEERLRSLEEKICEINKVVQEHSCSIDEFAKALMALTGADTTKQKSDLEIFQPITDYGDENWIKTYCEVDDDLLITSYGDVL